MTCAFNIMVYFVAPSQGNLPFKLGYGNVERKIGLGTRRSSKELIMERKIGEFDIF